MRGITHLEELLLQSTGGGVEVASKLAHVDVADTVALYILTSIVLVTLSGNPSIGLGIELAHGCVAIESSLILNETAVRRHIGEEHHGDTTCEETSTATNLQRLVTKDVVVESETRRDNQLVRGPLTCVNVTAFVVECQNGIVGQQVVVVEHQLFETQTVGQLQLVGDVPLVLCIKAHLVIGNTGSGLVLAVVTIGQGNNLRCCTCEEIVH